MNDQLARFYARQYGDQYIDESPNLPPATEEAINTGLERLLMASMPFQVLLMQIRHLYRWEDPTETALWFAGYIICWAVGQLGGAAVSRILLPLIPKRFFASDKPASDNGHALDSDQTTSDSAKSGRSPRKY